MGAVRRQLPVSVAAARLERPAVGMPLDGNAVRDLSELVGNHPEQRLRVAALLCAANREEAVVGGVNERDPQPLARYFDVDAVLDLREVGQLLDGLAQPLRRLL